MRPVDTEALEDAAWQQFVRALGDQLAGEWPAMKDRLGERQGTFVELAVEQALQRGFTLAAGVARYVNLWFVWGPAFHDKPGFEWARAALAEAAPGDEWPLLHRLLQRSLLELTRMPDARVAPRALAEADTRLVERFGPLGRRGDLARGRRPQPPPLPLAACDLEAAELRLMDDGMHSEYTLEAGDWRRVPVPLPAPLRVDATRALPASVTLLSPQPGEGRATRLQARLRAHAVCDGDRHPAVAFIGPHGRWDWAGHETRAVSWPVASRRQPLPAPGPGAAIAEETSPELYRLHLDSCGLRDEGRPLGPLRAEVSAWPAAQWWLEVQRAQPAAQSLLPGSRPWQRGVTRCRIERDGTPQDAAPQRQHFEDGLDADTGVALHRLAAAWEQVPALSSPRLDAQLGLLTGRSALTWGWRLGPQGLAGPPLMRLLARFEMNACQAEIELGGELALGASRSRLTLRCAGSAGLRQELRHETATPPLAEVLEAGVARWRFPFVVQIEALAGDSGALLQAAGPAGGALVGEAGLRPCTKGSSGWTWFVRLRVEPVLQPLALVDPLLGVAQQTLPLLPELTLLDWSLG